MTGKLRSTDTGFAVFISLFSEYISIKCYFTIL